MTHKSRIWRDIDKNPLPENACQIDVKLSCGSILVNCRSTFELNPFDSRDSNHVTFMGNYISKRHITQWRDA